MSNLQTPEWQVLDEGMVHACLDPDGTDIAASSRCAVLADGRLLCSYMLQSAISRNDFVPHLAESADQGATWQPRGPIWPHLAEAFSINVSLARGGDGSLSLLGTRTPRTAEHESFWCQQTLGILQNKILWSRSTDEGQTWDEPQTIDVPFAGSAEVPAPMCITRSGTWVAPYSPHNTFDPNLEVDLRQVVVMISKDRGETWQPRIMLRATEPEAYFGEAWVTQMADGGLLGTVWHIMRGEKNDLPHACALSYDDGDTWCEKFSSGIQGQSASSAALPDGRVLFAYNQREPPRPGVWMAVARPEPGDFGLIRDDPVWLAPQSTQTGTRGKSEQWTDFAFGEPSVTLLDERTALVTFWCIQPDYRGIRFVKVEFA
jgi:hypothetical protein